MDFFKAVGIGTVALLDGVVAYSLYEMYGPMEFCCKSLSGNFPDSGEAETSSETQLKSQRQEEGKSQSSTASAT